MPQVRGTIRDCGLAIAIIQLILSIMVPGSWLGSTALVQRLPTVVSHCEPALIAYTLPAMEGDKAMELNERDKLIIAYALSLCPIAELGDRVGGNDSETASRVIELAAMFDADIADDMRQFQHQFKP